MLKTMGFALGFQHFPRDLANVNEWNGGGGGGVGSGRVGLGVRVGVNKELKFLWKSKKIGGVGQLRGEGSGWM